MSQSAPKQERQRRILIAEDDPAIANLLARYLQRDYEVEVADSGTAALAMVNRQPYPDLLLLDVMMPGLDGLGVAQRVRLLPHMSRVPIIFLTAKNQPMDVIRGIQAGARHYISKPFKLEDVLSKIKKALP